MVLQQDGGVEEMTDRSKAVTYILAVVLLVEFLIFSFNRTDVYMVLLVIITVLAAMIFALKWEKEIRWDGKCKCGGNFISWIYVRGSNL